MKSPIRSLHLHLGDGTRLFFRRMRALVVRPIFLALTFGGNGLIAIGTVGLYHLEHEVNPHVGSYLDTLWWAVSTVTTVGYGDIHPVTTAGKWLGIVMMLCGITLFCSFTGLFASAIIEDDIGELEAELRTVDRSLERIERDLEAVGMRERERLAMKMERTLRKLRG